MRKIHLLTILVFSVLRMQAQGLSNFFSQKEADIKYMLQQIAALQAYIGYAEKGYSIAQKGLSLISNLKKGEFDLHSAFFSSLSAVNPAVRKYSNVAEIVSYQLSIVKSFEAIIHLKNMSPAETGYLSRVYKNIADDCTRSLSELIDVITDGTYQMKDNERLKRIDEIYAGMKDKYAFAKSFTSEARLLAAQRGNETGETNFLKTMELK